MQLARPLARWAASIGQMPSPEVYAPTVLFVRMPSSIASLGAPCGSESIATRRSGSSLGAGFRIGFTLLGRRHLIGARFGSSSHLLRAKESLHMRLGVHVGYWGLGMGPQDQLQLSTKLNASTSSDPYASAVQTESKPNASGSRLRPGRPRRTGLTPQPCSPGSLPQRTASRSGSAIDGAEALADDGDDGQPRSTSYRRRMIFSLAPSCMCKWRRVGAAVRPPSACARVQ